MNIMLKIELRYNFILIINSGWFIKCDDSILSTFGTRKNQAECLGIFFRWINSSFKRLNLKSQDHNRQDMLFRISLFK